MNLDEVNLASGMLPVGTMPKPMQREPKSPAAFTHGINEYVREYTFVVEQLAEAKRHRDHWWRRLGNTDQTLRRMGQELQEVKVQKSQHEDHMEQLRNDLNARAEVESGLRTELEGEKKRAGSYLSKIETVKVENDRIAKNLEERVKENGDVQARLDASQREEEERTAERDELQLGLSREEERNEILQSSQEMLQEEVSKLNRVVGTCKEAEDRLEIEKADLSKQLNASESSLDAEKSAKDKLAAEIVTWKKDLADAKDQILNLKTKVATDKQRLDRISALETEKKEVEAQNGKLRRDLDEEEREKDRILDDLQHEKEEKRKVQSDLEAQKSRVIVVEKQLHGRTDELEETKDQLNAANEARDKLSAEYEALNTDMNSITGVLWRRKPTHVDDPVPEPKFIREDVTHLKGQIKSIAIKGPTTLQHPADGDSSSSDPAPLPTPREDAFESGNPNGSASVGKFSKEPDLASPRKNSMDPTLPANSSPVVPSDPRISINLKQNRSKGKDPLPATTLEGVSAAGASAQRLDGPWPNRAPPPRRESRVTSPKITNPNSIPTGPAAEKRKREHGDVGGPRPVASQRRFCDSCRPA